MTNSIPDNTPVLVGVGMIAQRELNPAHAWEPLELMVAAAKAAARDTSVAGLLTDTRVVYVPRGRWRYRDPGRAIAQRIGARRAQSVLAHVGVLQEALVGQACERILSGDIDIALVVGGDAGFRLLRSRITGQEVIDDQQESDPDEVLRAAEPIMDKAEIDGGLGHDAPAYYAVLDNAFRVRHGVDVMVHRTQVAEIYSAFSRVAEGNPHAWRQSVVKPQDIRDPSERNPMLAFPYTKMHTSDWSVDQASALILCSAGKARAAGVPADKWIFPRATAVSNHMTSMSRRASLDRSPGAEIAAREALDIAGTTADKLELVDLYSCFPIAVLHHAEAIGFGIDQPLTFTGGMRFAGGPFNNYVLHTTAQLASRLRLQPDSVGLVSSVSGVLTKHAFSVWSSSPADGYRFVDVTDEVSLASETKELEIDFSGVGSVAGYTVRFDKGAPTLGVAIVDTASGGRAIATTGDGRVMNDMTEFEFTGRDVRVSGGHFVPTTERVGS